MKVCSRLIPSNMNPITSVLYQLLRCPFCVCISMEPWRKPILSLSLSLTLSSSLPLFFFFSFSFFFSLFFSISCSSIMLYHSLYLYSKFVSILQHFTHLILIIIVRQYFALKTITISFAVFFVFFLFCFFFVLFFVFKFHNDALES